MRGLQGTFKGRIRRVPDRFGLHLVVVCMGLHEYIRLLLEESFLEAFPDT